jgi:hypothetical protein
MPCQANIAAELAKLITHTGMPYLDGEYYLHGKSLTWISGQSRNVDNDGILDSDDSDIDGDGLTNGVETNTGFFVSTSDTGTNPRNADTDGDGYSDGAEVNGTSALARVTSPLKVNYNIITVAGSFQSPENFQANPIPLVRL